MNGELSDDNITCDTALSLSACSSESTKSVSFRADTNFAPKAKPKKKLSHLRAAQKGASMKLAAVDSGATSHFVTKDHDGGAKETTRVPVTA